MPKVTKILPPTADAIPPKPASKFELPGEDWKHVADDPIPADAGEAETATPEEMRPLTILILTLICKVVKGDEPTDHEVNLVNPPLTAVANKYNLSNRWAPELALFGSLIIVVQASRRRAAKMAPQEDTPRQRDRAEEPLNLHQFAMGDDGE